MKLINYLLLFFLSIHILPAQEKPVRLSHYVFPEFTLGQVLMKNGVKNSALLNYNTLSKEMVFDANGEILAIADEQLKSIDTVFIDNRKFIRSKDKFLEVIKLPKTNLFVAYECRVKYPGRVNGPGGRTSQTSSSETYAPVDFRRIIYKVVLPEGYEVNPFQVYWLEKEGGSKKFKNLNQLMKLYGNKKEEFKDYLKSHDVKYDNVQDIVKLIERMEES